MKTRIFILFFIIFTFTIHSQPKERNFLFINTFPLRADVVINGKSTKISTPCILKNEQIENSVIILKKEGYRDYRLSNKEIEMKSLDLTLIPSSFDLFFPEKSNYIIGGTELKGPVYVSQLKPGKYDISLINNKMSFSRSSVFLPVEVALGTTFGLSLATMIASIAISEYFANQAFNLEKSLDTEDARIDYEFYKRSTQTMDSVKFGFIASTAVFAIALTAVITVDIVGQQQFRRKEMRIVNKTPSTQDETFYDTAIQFMSSGDIGRSTQILQSILSLFPLSDRIPYVHYQLGQNFFIMQDYEKAKEHWEIFIRDYPIAEYYDYVIKNLADIYYAQEDYDTARFLLDRIVFTGDVINKEAIYSLKARIDYDRYMKSKSDDVFLLAEEEYFTLIDEFPHSEKLDIYYLMLIKLYKTAGKADKINILKEKIESNSSVDEAMKRLILSYFS